MNYQGMTAEESDYLDFLKDDLDTQTRLAWFAFEYVLAIESEDEEES